MSTELSPGLLDLLEKKLGFRCRTLSDSREAPSQTKTKLSDPLFPQGAIEGSTNFFPQKRGLVHPDGAARLDDEYAALEAAWASVLGKPFWDHVLPNGADRVPGKFVFEIEQSHDTFESLFDWLGIFPSHPFIIQRFVTSEQVGA